MSRRSRAALPDDHEEDDMDESLGDMDGENRDADVDNQLVKKLVRYALACEYARVPIRREGIKEKVLGPHGRAFRRVYQGAQKQLIARFGMRMVEMPARDRATLTADQRRKAAKSQTQASGSNKNAYMLVSNLGDQFRTPSILQPSRIQSPEGEAAYIALYTMLISIITLAGGELSDPQLRRHLTRLNIANNMPGLLPTSHGHTAVEKSDIVLARMVKQGYLVKVTETKVQGDEETAIWHVGPRGKVEVDNEAIARVVRSVYGGSSDELEQKLQTSLKVMDRKPALEEVSGDVDDEADEEGSAAAGLSGGRGRRPRRSRRNRDEEEEEDED